MLGSRGAGLKQSEEYSMLSGVDARWLEYVGNEQWIKVLEMHDALTKDIIEGIIIPGLPAVHSLIKRIHIDLLLSKCKLGMS